MLLSPRSSVSTAGSFDLGTIVGAFEGWAAADPERPAIVTDEGTLSYGALNDWANRIAGALIVAGVPPGSVAATICEHGPARIAMSVGLAKAGVGTAPLQLTAADHSLRDLIAHCGTAMLVTDRASALRVRDLAGPGYAHIDVDALVGLAPIGDVHRAPEPDATGYLRYTSGSTGDPKGVIYTFEQLRQAMRRHAGSYPVLPDDRVAVFESYGANTHLTGLNIGACLAPYALGRRGVVGLGEWINRHAVSVVPAFPTIFRQFLRSLPEGTFFPSVRTVSLIGEPVFVADLDLLYRFVPAACVYVNVFGISECSSALDFHYRRGDRLDTDIVPAGYPREGIEVRLLDDALQPVPPGEIGEIALRGTGLPLGYLNRPDLTAAVYLPDPDGGDRRMYLTRDLGRFDEAGCLHVVGRKDDQIKVRNAKFLLADADRAILACPAVLQGAAKPFRNAAGETRLAAYVVPSDPANFSPHALRGAMAEAVPDYMVPSVVVVLDALPMTTTGKVDRKVLPAPTTVSRPGGGPPLPPRDGTEETLLAIWEDVLGLAGLGVVDDFFAIGGDSLQATQVLIDIQHRFGVTLTAADLLADGNTIAGLARAIAARGVSAADPGKGDAFDFVEFGGPDGGRVADGHFTIDRATGLRRARPGARIGRATINALGFRGPDIAVPKPPGTLRLAFLGNSVTFGAACDDDGTWPQAACDLLRAHVPGVAFDYVNASMPGYNTRQLSVVFREHVAPLAPDIVVIRASDLNADTAYLARRAGLYDGVHWRAGALSRRWAAAAKAEKTATVAWRLLFAHDPRGKVASLPADLAEPFAERLDALVRLCRSHAPLVVLAHGCGRLRRSGSRLGRLRAAQTSVLYMPYLTIPALFDAQDAYRAAIRRVAGSTGATLVDLGDMVPADGAHFLDSAHYTAAGARRFARGFADTLAETAPFRALVDRPPG